MERVQKIDVEKLKRYILTEEVASAIKSGASSITTQGVTYRIKDNTITTII